MISISSTSSRISDNLTTNLHAQFFNQKIVFDSMTGGEFSSFKSVLSCQEFLDQFLWNVNINFNSKQVFSLQCLLFRETHDTPCLNTKLISNVCIIKSHFREISKCTIPLSFFFFASPKIMLNVQYDPLALLHNTTCVVYM